MERCSNCRFMIGQECRRNAPIPSQAFRQPIWPMPRTNDWCGEYQPHTGGDND
jgi:hypothetical protein